MTSTPREHPFSLRYCLQEIILGKRGLIKVNFLWLPLAILLSTQVSDFNMDLILTGFLIFITVSCWILATILTNDLSDSADDRSANKVRWIGTLPGAASLSLIMGLLGISLAVIIFSKCPRATLWVFLGVSILGLSYSIKPIRFKKRGVWGIFVYSLACALSYVAIPWTWLSAPLLPLLILAPGVFLSKWVQLHFHQVIDYEEDFKRGIQTYAVSAGIKRTQKSLQWVAFLTSFWTFFILVYSTSLHPSWRWIILSIEGGVLAVCAIYVIYTRKHSPEYFLLGKELPWLYLGMTYAVFHVLPLIIFFRLVLYVPLMLSFLVLSFFFFIIESRFYYHYYNV